MQNEIIGLIQNLISKSKKGEVNWLKGDLDDQYEVKLTNSQLVIDKGAIKGEEVYIFRVLNSKGEKVADLIGNKLAGSDLELLKNLFKVAVDQYLKKDQVIASVFNDLKNPGMVGEEEFKIPF